MTIESSLAELTSAVKELNATIKAAGLGAAPKEASEKPAGKQSSAKTQPAADSKPTAAEKEPDAAAASPKAEPSAKPLDYDTDVAPLFMKYFGKFQRAKAQEFIDQFKPGAKKLKDAVSPEQYADVVAKLNKALA